MIEQPRLGAVAESQLAAWEEIAATWAMYAEGPQMRCASCHMAIRRIADDTGAVYVYSDGQLRALTVAHLRQAHLELDPDR